MANDIPNDIWKSIIQVCDDATLAQVNKYLNTIYKDAIKERMRKIKVLVGEYNNDPSNGCGIQLNYYCVHDHTVAFKMVPKAAFDYRNTNYYHTFTSVYMSMYFPIRFADSVKVNEALCECTFAGVTLFPNPAFQMRGMPHYHADGHIDKTLNLFDKFLPAPYKRNDMQMEIAKIYLMFARTYKI